MLTLVKSKLEITHTYMFSDHNGIKLELNRRKIFGKSPNIWKLNNTLLNLWNATKGILRGNL